MTPRLFRRALRWIHLIGGIIVGTYLYSPWSENALFSIVTLYGVVPILGLTGIAMWQQGRLNGFLRRDPG